MSSYQLLLVSYSYFLCSQCCRAPSAYIWLSLLFAGGESSSLRMCILCVSKNKTFFFSIMPSEHEHFVYKDYENAFRNKTEASESQGFLLNMLIVFSILPSDAGIQGHYRIRTSPYIQCYLERHKKGKSHFPAWHPSLTLLSYLWLRNISCGCT